MTAVVCEILCVTSGFFDCQAHSVPVRPELRPTNLWQTIGSARVKAEPPMGPDPVRGAREPVRPPAELPFEERVPDLGPVLPG